MSRVALLDVNVLVALFDPDHVHHDLAHDWFADEGSGAWATCPTTENGFVRVVSSPSYRAPVSRAPELLARLRRFCEAGGHVFWQDSVTLRDDAIFDPAMLASHRQLTDVYPLGLAHARGGRLATFDRSVSLRAARGASAKDLALIGLAD